MNLTIYLQEISRKRPIFGFAGVGLISTVLDVLFLKLGLAIHAPLWLATAIGFLVGLMNGYILNSAFVFQKARTGASSIKYALISIGGLGITEVIVQLLTIWHPVLGALQAKLVAVVVVFFWNYILSRLWAFR